MPRARAREFFGVHSHDGRSRSPTKRRYSIISSPSLVDENENDTPYTYGPDDSESPQLEDTSNRRKSVTFSCVDSFSSGKQPSSVLQVTTNANDPKAERRRSRSSVMPPKAKVLQPILKAHAGDSRDRQPEPASPRKRRYSNMAPPLPIDPSGYPEEGDEEQPSPRKKRFSSINSPDTRAQSSHDNFKPSDDDYDSSSSGSSDSASDLTPTSHSGRYIIPTPQTIPPPAICTQVNTLVGSTLNNTRFDFAAHVKHRTYVVRTLHLPDPDECVTVLDVGVDALLPSSLPPHVPAVGRDFEETSFYIAKAPGKGLGMFAERLLRPNEVILVEHPTVVIPLVLGFAVPLKDLCADVFGRLSKAVRQELDDVIFAVSGSGGTVEDFEKLLRLNALAISLLVPDEDSAELSTHRGIFLKTGRCNHR